jgi:asparagine synthase (glutamine-hydrolysing)
MCGIFALINHKTINREKIYKSFEQGKNRGPEHSITKEINNFFIGFHRLAINGINEESNQPFFMKNCLLICNGEIYNFKKLAQDNNIHLNTDSDCEIIIHIYKLYGIEYTLHLLDGVFSFVLYDKDSDTVFIARDPYGIRPLYYFDEDNIYGFSSELKSIYDLPKNKTTIKTFLPSTYLIISNIQTNISLEFKKYATMPFTNTLYNDFHHEKLHNIAPNIVSKIKNAVKKRVVGTTDRPIACLLSGGLDSSLIAALVSNELKQADNQTEKLKTFSIGLPGSEDLKYAKIVAEHIDSDHHEVILSEDDFFNAIPEVIHKIESYDTTTVRASVGNYLIAKYISEMTNCKVIFNGDGADELMGGYLYFKNSPNEYAFDKECRRLLTDIHIFDVLRSDKSISSNGLEPRTPFLDREWVEYYLTIDRKIRFNVTKNNCEKYLIRKSFSIVNPELLPEKILWRTKEAFSDGVSSLNKSWYEIINEKINNICNNDIHLKEKLFELQQEYKNIAFANNKNINLPDTLEKCYYRFLFNKHYNKCDHLIPYYWMPKFVNAKDASARSLLIYNANNTNKKV